jgi:hypothetical protein
MATQIFGTNADETLTGTSGSELIYGRDGNDVLLGLGDNDVLYGGNGNDRLFGGDGNDQMSGDAGDDFMRGGLGNDTYFVDSSGDKVRERADEGIDSVASSISYRLGRNVENLRLTGSDDVNAFGNSLGNTIKGNAGDNVISGGRGNDKMNGDAGDDVLIGGRGNDEFTGGTGADTFLIQAHDAVSGSPGGKCKPAIAAEANHDIIFDLNFDDGDVLWFKGFRKYFNDEGGDKVAPNKNAFAAYEKIDTVDEFKVLINLVTAHDDMSVTWVDHAGATNDRLVFDFGDGHKTTLLGTWINSFITSEIADTLAPDAPDGSKVLASYFAAAGGATGDLALALDIGANKLDLFIA